MKIRLVNLSQDYEMISSWWKERGLPVPNKSQYSQIGYIVDNICAGFLYQTDSSLCLIENFISNPNTTKEERSNALDKLFNILLDAAKEMDFKTVLSFTNYQTLANMGMKNHSFIPMDFKVFMRSL